MRSGPVRFVGVVVAAVLAVGCGGDDGAGPDESPTTTASIPADDAPDGATDGGTDDGAGDEPGDPAPPPTTVAPVREPAVDDAILAIAELVDDEGALPVDAALGVVSALLAPLPGVEPLELDGEPPHDLAGAAVRRLLAAYDRLDPEIADALTELLELDIDDDDEQAVTPRGLRRSAPDTGRHPASIPSSEELRDRVAAIVADLEALSGHRMSLPIIPRVVAPRATGGDAMAFARVYRGRITGCRIWVPDTYFGDDAPSITSTLAHEVWHCFQLDASPGAFDTAPLWVVEGQAEWAGEAYVGGSASSASRWDTWLMTPGSTLWRRSYDAIGIYAVAAQSGSDPWRTMLPMLGRGNVAAIETLFGSGVDDAVLATARALVRAPAVGPPWESTGPGITPTAVAPVLTPGAEADAEVRATLGRFAALPVVLAVPAGDDVVRVTIEGGSSGALELPGTGVIQTGGSAIVRLCLLPEGCECPDGSVPGGGSEPLVQARPGEGAAAIASLDGGDARLAARFESLEDLCARRLPGVWVADARQVFEAFTGPYGGAGGIDCSGPYTITFGTDGSFALDVSATCRFGDRVGTGSGSLRGSYDEQPLGDDVPPGLDLGTEAGDDVAMPAAVAGRVLMTDVTGSGSMQLGELAMPLPIVDGLAQAVGLPTLYVIDPSSGTDVLTLYFSAPDGTPLSVTLVRAG